MPQTGDYCKVLLHECILRKRSNIENSGYNDASYKHFFFPKWLMAGLACLCMTLACLPLKSDM